MRDDARYMYSMVRAVGGGVGGSGGGKKEEEGAFRYKRYKLSDQKTFDSLFFPEKVEAT